MISLGAGFDTLFWRLRDAKAAIGSFFEVDHGTVVKMKRDMIARSPLLRKTLEDPTYHLLATDLRDVNHLAQVLTAAGMNYSTNTIILSECVLVYLSPEHSAALISWAAVSFISAAYIDYEPMQPYDAFGKMMVQNLQRRGCPLLGIEACADLTACCERFQVLVEILTFIYINII